MDADLKNAGAEAKPKAVLNEEIKEKVKRRAKRAWAQMDEVQDVKAVKRQHKLRRVSPSRLIYDWKKAVDDQSNRYIEVRRDRIGRLYVKGLYVMPPPSDDLLAAP